MRLFCLPHAGGGASAFHTWNNLLPASLQICSVLLPGREGRLSEPLFTQIDSLADAIASELQPWLNIPFAVFGHSMGALLAFEWVRRLQRRGHPMPVWLFLSGRRAPGAPDDSSPLNSLSDGEFLNELTRRYDGIPQEFLVNEDLMEVFLPILRADISVVESFLFHEVEPLDCPITVFAGMNDGSVSWDQLLAWERHTRKHFSVRLLPGGHFYPHGPMLNFISATLAELLP
jgi:medium-chain acyl-[acyl-carrier-protein] hydrolase